MEKTLQKYFAKIASFNEEGKYVDAIILHFDQANENGWMPKTGCLDAFLARVQEAAKFIPAYYDHGTTLIGQWRDLEISEGALKGRLYLDDIPFVRDTVIPQLKSGSLQGASPTVSPENAINNNGIVEISLGVLVEASLVGIPADLKADILTMKASIEEKQKEDFEFELLTL